MAKKLTPTPPAKKPKAKAKPKAEPKTEPPAKRTIVGDFELGQHYGVDKKSVYNWRKDGMPATKLPGNKWEYDLDQTDPWVEAKRHTGEPDDELSAIRKEIALTKLRTERAKASSLERENELAEGNVLDREATELKITEVIQSTRDALLRIPTVFHAHLCKKCQPKRDELKKQIEHALTQLAKKLTELRDDEDDD
jgi:phage terminase Nu1 subunit (DNA packaging protein)